MGSRRPGGGGPPRARLLPAATTGLVVTLGLVLPAGAAAGPLARALDHLAARQDPVGGGFSAAAGTDPVYTTWAALAVTSAGERPERWRAGRASLRDALARPAALAPLGDLAAMAVAAAGAGLDPRDLGGRNVLRAVLAAQGGDGAIGDRASTTAWGILALRAGGLGRGARSIRRARTALERSQGRDGGWASGGLAAAPDPNTSAAAVQALVATGVRPGAATLRRARSFLRRAQNPDGGFPALRGGESTALTTAWVTVALRALGERPDHEPWARGGGPVGLLGRLQLPDGGVRNQRSSAAASTWATAQAALAFAPGPLPLGPRGGRQTPPRTPHAALRDESARLVVRYGDDQGGTGVDPRSVRVRAGDRDLTGAAKVTRARLVMARRELPAGQDTLELRIADRAGNARSIRLPVR